MKEPVSVSVSIQTDKDTRKSLAVSEQERQEPLCLSCLGIPFRHSRNRAILGHLQAGGIITLWKRSRGIQRHCRAVTGYSESVILSDMAGTSKQAATIRPTPNKHRWKSLCRYRYSFGQTRTAERALLYRNRAGTSRAAACFSSFGEPMAIWGGTGELNPKAILCGHCSDKICACDLRRRSIFSWYRSQIMRIIFFKKVKILYFFFQQNAQLKSLK